MPVPKMPRTSPSELHHGQWLPHFQIQCQLDVPDKCSHFHKGLEHLQVCGNVAQCGLGQEEHQSILETPAHFHLGDNIIIKEISCNVHLVHIVA